MISLPQNVIDVPIVCPPGQKLDATNKCREVWGRQAPLPSILGRW